MFLDSGHQKTNKDFESHVDAIRSCLADGHLNDANDWLEWTDSLIFREEQRAIGESMIDQDLPSVIGYGSFCNKFVGAGGSSTNPWIAVATNFLADLKSVSDGKTRDFRRARCLLLIMHGASLIYCLDKDRFQGRLSALQDRAQKELANMPVRQTALPKS